VPRRLETILGEGAGGSKEKMTGPDVRDAVWEEQEICLPEGTPLVYNFDRSWRGTRRLWIASLVFTGKDLSTQLLEVTSWSGLPETL